MEKSKWRKQKESQRKERGAKTMLESGQKEEQQREKELCGTGTSQGKGMAGTNGESWRRLKGEARKRGEKEVGKGSRPGSSEPYPPPGLIHSTSPTWAFTPTVTLTMQAQVITGNQVKGPQTTVI